MRVVISQAVAASRQTHWLTDYLGASRVIKWNDISTRCRRPLMMRSCLTDASGSRINIEAPVRAGALGRESNVFELGEQSLRCPEPQTMLRRRSAEQSSLSGTTGPALTVRERQRQRGRVPGASEIVH